jgi:hypothetical protein
MLFTPVVVEAIQARQSQAKAFEILLAQLADRKRLKPGHRWEIP